jgi:hypothetical protein
MPSPSKYSNVDVFLDSAWSRIAHPPRGLLKVQTAEVAGGPSLPITLIALTALHGLLGFTFAILGQRTTDIVTLFELTVRVSANEAFVTSRINALSFPWSFLRDHCSRLPDCARPRSLGSGQLLCHGLPRPVLRRRTGRL